MQIMWTTRFVLKQFNLIPSPLSLVLLVSSPHSSLILISHPLTAFLSLRGDAGPAMGEAWQQGVGPVRRRGTAGARHWEPAPLSAGKGGVTKVRGRACQRAMGPASRGSAASAI